MPGNAAWKVGDERCDDAPAEAERGGDHQRARGWSEKEATAASNSSMASSTRLAVS